MASATSAPGFQLTIVDGRAVLASAPTAGRAGAAGDLGGDAGQERWAAGALPAGWGRIDRLALEVPGLRFPFDLSQGARSFRDRRCTLIDLAWSLGPEELLAALMAAPLARFGLGQPTVALVTGGAHPGLRLGLRASVAGREAELSAKLVVTPGGAGRGTFRLAIAEARLHGLLALPAPLLLAAVPVALGLIAPGDGQANGHGASDLSTQHFAIRTPALVRPRGLTEWDVDLAGLICCAWLAPAGWRLPSCDEISALPVSLQGDRVALAVQRRADDDGPDADASPASLVDPAGRGVAALAEVAFAAGEVVSAAEGFRRALDAEPDNDFARERLFQLLGTRAASLPELEKLADDYLEGRPEFALGLVAKGVAAAELGRAGESAWLYTRLAERSAEAGEPVDEAAARLAAAAQWLAVGDQDAAGKALRRALELRPGHAWATAALANLGKPASA